MSSKVVSAVRPSHEIARSYALHKAIGAFKSTRPCSCALPSLRGRFPVKPAEVPSLSFLRSSKYAFAGGLSCRLVLRIKDYVAQNGVDQFSLEDFYYVGSKVSTDPARLVLVGGQAIEAWGHFYGIVAPTGNAQPLTEDLDWYGNKDAAIWLCNQLGRETVQLKLAEVTDSSPNTAVALHQRPDGRVVLMDFLGTLIGIDSHLITERAVPVQVGPVKLHILHPLLCLESRLANLHRLSSKRNGNGKMQALWAIDIVAAFLVQMAGSGAPKRQLMKACLEIAEAAEYRSGPFCYDEFAIDPLIAVTDDIVAAVGGLFVTEEWPRRTARIHGRRKARQARQDLLKQRISYTISFTSRPKESVLRRPADADAPIQPGLPDSA